METYTGLKKVVALSLVLLGFGSVAHAAPTLTYGGDFNIPISDRKIWGSPVTEAIIQVPEHLTIVDLDIALTISHTNVFDLQIYLQSPLGTRIPLNYYSALNEFFRGADYIQTVFDDEASVPIEQGSAPFTGRFRPKAGSFLDVFDGEDACGQWKLQIYDLWFWDTGTLNSAELIFTTSRQPEVIPEPAAATLLLLGFGLTALFHRQGRR
jgi:subtilisin-like proprotein convertase family protein